MTGNVRILLAQIAVLEQQHRAGINPLCTELGAFFDTARLARQDIAAIDAGMTPDPCPTRLAPAVVSRTTFERVADVRIPGGEVARFAKALLDALGRSSPIGGAAREGVL